VDEIVHRVEPLGLEADEEHALEAEHLEEAHARGAGSPRVGRQRLKGETTEVDSKNKSFGTN
jgi:hypothetical protein